MNDRQVKAFIVGMSRSGTTALSKALNNHPSLSVIGETTFWGRNFVDTYSDLTCGDFENLLDKTAGRLLYDEKYNQILLSDIKKKVKDARRQGLMNTPKDLFNIYCNTVLEHEKKEFIIEKTPHHVHFYRRIKRYYPEARFIILQRDPYEFMLSYKHQGDRKPEAVKKMFNKLYHPVGTSFILKKYLQSISELRSDYPEDSLFFSLSEIKEDPPTVINKICEFLQVEDFTDRYIQKRNSSFVKKEKPELKSSDIFWLNQIIGSSLEENGFMKREQKYNLFEILKSIVLLPYWGFFVSKRILTGSNDWKRYMKKMLS